MSTAIPPTVLLPSCISSKYKITAEIARGGFATVYLSQQHQCHDEQQQHYAIKVMTTAHLTKRHQDRLAKEPEYHERCANHPNVVLVKEYVVAGTQIVVVTEYVKGKDLGKEIVARRNVGMGFQEHEVVSIMRQTLSAVKHVHNQGILHRDIKPANLFVSGMKVKLGDFGFATEFQEGQPWVGHISGTPCYMSPEMFSGRCGKPSDVWACGVVLYELMTLRRPFLGSNMEDLCRDVCYGAYLPVQKPMSSSSLSNNSNSTERTTKQYSIELVELVDAMLHKDPAARITIEDALAKLSKLEKIN